MQGQSKPGDKPANQADLWWWQRDEPPWWFAPLMWGGGFGAILYWIYQAIQHLRWVP